MPGHGKVCIDRKWEQEEGWAVGVGQQFWVKEPWLASGEGAAEDIKLRQHTHDGTHMTAHT